MESLFNRERYYWQSPPMVVTAEYYLDQGLPHWAPYVTFPFTFWLKFRNPPPDPDDDPCIRVPGHIQFDLTISLEYVIDGGYCTYAFRVQFYERLRGGLLKPTISELRYLPIGQSLFPITPQGSCGFRTYGILGNILDQPMRIIYSSTPNQGFNVPPDCSPIDFSQELSTATFRNIVNHIWDVILPDGFSDLYNWIRINLLHVENIPCNGYSFPAHIGLTQYSYIGNECPCFPQIPTPPERDDCPPGSTDCDDFEDRSPAVHPCPEAVYDPGYCNVSPQSIIHLGNDYYQTTAPSTVCLMPPSITNFRRGYNPEEDVWFCATEGYSFGEPRCNSELITWFADTSHCDGDPSCIINTVTGVLCSYFRDHQEGDEIDETDGDNIGIGPEPDRPCGLYIILSIAIGVKFSYPNDDLESPQSLKFKYALYKTEVKIDIPIALTNEQMRRVNLIDPLFDLELDFEGIAFGLSFGLTLGGVSIGSSRLSWDAVKVDWVSIFPQYAPILAVLSLSPIAPFAGIAFGGVGRHVC